MFFYILHLYGIGDQYFPVWSDEFFYYVNSKYYSLTHSLEAAYTYNGTGAALLGADAHGPMYPLLHGNIAGIFGENPVNMIYTNVFMLFIGVIAIICTSLLSRENKMFAAAMILFFPVGYLYSFTFMQESVQILLAVLIGICTLGIYTTSSRTYLIFFLTLTLISVLFRPSWIFALILLFPKIKKVPKQIFFLLFFASASVISMVFMKYFFEPVPNFMNTLMEQIVQLNFSGAIKTFVQHFGLNLKRFFSLMNGPSYLLLKILVPITGILVIFRYFKTKKPVLLAVSLFFLLNCLVLK